MEFKFRKGMEYLKTQTNNEEKDHGKKIIILIIIVIIILTLITSCGCTSKFFGKLGGPLLDGINNAFRKEEDHIIDDNTNDKEIISNQELKFDVSHYEMLLGTSNAKISFTYKTINPKKLTCSTSDASVATCYVKDGYVVVNAKTAGSVDVVLQTTVNGKVYEASTHVTVKEPLTYEDDPNTIINNNNSNNTNNNNNSSNMNNNNNSTSPRDNNYLRNINVLNPNYKLNRPFDKNVNSYSITVNNGEKQLSLTATLDNLKSSATYLLNNKKIGTLNNLPLKEGKNILQIIVKSESGKTNTYIIEINNPVRTIRFEHSTYYIKLGKPYDIKYFVEEDGKRTDSYDINDVKVSLSEYEDECLISVNKGYITISPLDSIGGKNVDINISYKDKTSKSKLSFIEYKLDTYQKQYDIPFSSNYGEKYIILNSNIFDEQNIITKASDNKKEINICSKDNNFCVNLSVDSSDDGGNIKLEYTGETSSPMSLPFKIIASSIGTSIIHVKASAYGKEFTNFDIEVRVGLKYSVIINANGGLFNEFDNQYEFQLATDEILDLSKYDEPYKLDEECNIHKFVGYSLTPDGDILYNRTDKNIIKDLNNNLTLYAIYETVASPIEEKVTNKTLWLTDVSLFHNEEYYKKYKEDKVIYPGASGVYVMNFKNNSTSKITITGLTLKEKTICIDNKGCLNMGYIIKYSDTDSNDWTYYYGDTNSRYWILNSRPDTIKTPDGNFKSEIVFKDNEKIEMDPNENIAISIFWKWEEVNDSLDTLIGNYAAKKLNDQSINDMYGISIGINFEAKLESCKN